MKKSIILLIFISFVIDVLNAQKQKLNWIGLNASIFQGELIRYGGPVDGGYNYDGKIGFLIGVNFTRVFNDKIDVETGANFSWRKFYVSYLEMYPQGIPIDHTTSENVDLLTIPLNIKVKFRKQFSLTAGIEYDQAINQIDCATINSQTGIGANIKFGKDIIITRNMKFHVAPEIVVHDVIPFHPEKFQQRLTEFGLRIKYEFGIPSKPGRMTNL